MAKCSSACESSRRCVISGFSNRSLSFPGFFIRTPYTQFGNMTRYGTHLTKSPLAMDNSVDRCGGYLAGICVRLARVVVSRKHAPHVVHSIGGKNRCDLLTVWAVRLLASLLPSFSPCWFDRSFVGPFVRSFVRSSVPSFLPSFILLVLCPHSCPPSRACHQVPLTTDFIRVQSHGQDSAQRRIASDKI